MAGTTCTGESNGVDVQKIMCPWWHVAVLSMPLFLETGWRLLAVLFQDVIAFLLVVLTLLLLYTLHSQMDQSMMTWESNQVQGVQNIVMKLKSFGSIKHSVKTIDVQPSLDPSAILIFVTGSVVLDQNNPLHFCEMFQLVSSGNNQYAIHNDVFRLNYGL